MDGCLVAVAATIGRYEFNETGVLEYPGVVPFQQPFNFLRSTQLTHDPVGGGIVRALDHLFHVPAALGPVNEIAAFDLVKKGRCNKRFHQAGCLELDVLVDVDEFFARGEIINRPAGALVRSELAFLAETFDVVFDRSFDITDLPGPFDA